ncbi:MAG: transcription-repair coupling factor [Nitrospinaceae bacterium]|nr:MAG: transcription-repair coupling factor [Nitrospinaceae bacterium]
MNHSVSISGSASFHEQLEDVAARLKKASGPLVIEGLAGASRALFIARLRKILKNPILVLTSNSNTGESLLGDLKYFFRLEKVRTAPHFFPHWELLPYEHLSPLPEISGERLGVLSRLLGDGCPLLVAPVEAAMQGVVPRQVLRQCIFPVRVGEAMERELLETGLIDNGYRHVALVEEPGEFSVRGDIVDVYPPAFPQAIRVEFFGDQVESLRKFDIDTQVSMENLDAIDFLPVREALILPGQLEEVIGRIEARGREQGLRRGDIAEPVERLRHLGGYSGMEALTPFLYPQREFLFDYLPPDTLILLDEEELLTGQVENYEALVKSEFDAACRRHELAALPESFYLTAEEFGDRLDRRPRVALNALKLSGGDDAEHIDVKAIPPLLGRFESFAEKALEWEAMGRQVVIAAPTKGQVCRVQQLVDEYGLSTGVDRGAISAGFELPSAAMVFIAEHEIFGLSHKHRYRRKPKSQSFQRGFKDLKPGDYLVHIDYGIGRYLGTRELKTGVGGGEFLEILYADEEKLYIPMDGLGCVQKYVGGGDETAPALNKLGGVAWKRQKSKAQKAIMEMAEDLLKLYAKRELSKGVSYAGNPVLVQEFADAFEFEETEDQLNAIDDLEADLECGKPMDRLICGDVGYGKTEVAMRAAFKVVLQKKQVAVLVPTTLLAQQHLNTFRERFKNYPVIIESISRFRTAAEQRDILARLKKGEVDILIGTHRLLSKDTVFPDLGLIIIDEEQRFGVAHKEKLKKLRATVDILTLTATPIPRTLHFSLMGVRDLSVIETPPNDRLAVKTFVRKFNESVIHEAILRELDRNGQIYFVHNKVKSIHQVGEMIRRIVPQVRIGVAHGQMPEKQLESVMQKFIDHEIDLLLCTSIVESGLDIPAANTMLINRADQFGLAQLYQLRGRVGRYKHQAYAYLLIPGALAITPEARKRVAAIEELSDLGSGFQLAARDMEIRGVGNMLGHKQSGHISAIGFDLYCKMIEETVRELKGEKVETQVEPEIDLLIRGYVPKDYIADLNQRLEIYRRLQLIADSGERQAMEAELRDRYGPLPAPVEKLLGLIDIRILCRAMHISELRTRDGVARMKIEPTTPLDPGAAAALVDENMTFLSESRLGIGLSGKGWRKDIAILKTSLEKLLAACRPA